MTIYALRFQNQEPFVQYYFEGDIKLFVHINICIRNFGQCYFEEDMYYFQLYWHYNLCQCYFEENKIYRYSYLFALLQYSQRIQFHQFQNQLLRQYLEITATQIIPEQFRIGFQSRKCQKMIEWKQRVQNLHRFDVETKQKNPRRELIHFSSILKVKSTW